MRRTLLCIVLIAATISIFVLTPLGRETGLSAYQFDNGPAATDTDDVENLTLKEDGLSFRLVVGDLMLDDDGDLSAPQLNGRIREPDGADIPYYSTWIALPPGADVDISLENPEWTITEGVELSPNEEVEFQGLSLPGEIDFPAVGDGQLIARQSSPAGALNALFPRQAYDISEPMYVRDIRLVRLSLYPVRYNSVQRQLARTNEMKVNLTYTGDYPGVLRAAPSYGDVHGQALSSQVINWAQASEWRSLPPGQTETAVPLPINQDVYKIEVNRDGIYEITYSDLVAAGMNVGSVDPNSFQMLYRGQPVSFRFLGDQDALFEQNEMIHFFGWEFDGSRLEKQFFVNNVYWLWAGGTPSHVGEIASQPGTLVSSVLAAESREPENYWYASWTDQWDTFPNEPDAWYWDRYTKSNSTPITRTYAISLPYPAATGPDPIITAEFSSKNSPIPGGNPIPHIIRVYLNDQEIGEYQWFGITNFNVTATVPITQINDGGNQVDIVLATNAPVGLGDAVYLNRVTIEYQRILVADEGQSIFKNSDGGSWEYSVGGFDQGNTSGVVIWDISERLAPLSILSSTVEIAGAGPFTYTFGANHSGGSKFIATTIAGLQSPANISRFLPENLEPSGAGADWVAISHRDFITDVERLASHRAETSNGDLGTHVVDVESVINQYGYGLPLPSAIRDYLTHALTTWDLPPSYALLVGDSTINPRNNLNGGQPFFDPQFLQTDLAFVDRFQGQIPTDHVFSLLSGADILPDLAVGRIPVKTAAEIGAVVDKIIRFEENQLLPAGWMENILFIGEDADPNAGDFCLENQLVIDHIPDSFNRVELCQDDMDVPAMRTRIFSQVNLTGTTLLNYRGHGAVDYWGKNPIIMSTGDVDFWTNALRPVVIVTGDCLDGFFALPPTSEDRPNQGLAEIFLRAADGGSASHWSSSGLGYSAEHSELVEAFYDGLFLHGLTAVGDAANYAKLSFSQDGGHQSLLYSFILEGDPAMQLMRPSLSISAEPSQPEADRGDLIDFTIDVSNFGLYPSPVTVTDTLPTGMSYISATSSISATITYPGNDVVFDLQFGPGARNKGLPRNSTVSLTVTARIDSSAPGGALTNIARVGGFGLEAWPGDESDIALIYIPYNVLVPLLKK